jgi:hypothetical protein
MYGYERLSFDRDALPKRHVIRNLLSSGLRRRIIPGGIFIDLSTDFYVVIAGLAFPWTGRMGLAWFEVLTFDGIGRKVTIVLDRLATIAFRENRSIPDRSRHVILLRSNTTTRLRRVAVMVRRAGKTTQTTGQEMRFSSGRLSEIYHVVGLINL